MAHAARPAGAPWREHAERELMRSGHRAGGARDEVISLLARQSCCLSAQEIHDGLRAGGRRSPPLAAAARPSLFELSLANPDSRAWRTTPVLQAPRRFDLVGLRWAS